MRARPSCCSATTLNVQGQYNYTTLSVPGAADTYAYGISGNNIVGACNGGDEAFSYNRANGNYFTFSVPGAVDTYLRHFRHQHRGILLDWKHWQRIYLQCGATYPYTILGGVPEPGSCPYGISGTNIVVAYWNGSNNEGLLYNGNTYVILPLINGWAPTPYAISGTNIVGDYFIGSSPQGFLYNGSNYTIISVPGAEYTYPHGIDGTKIVGFYYNGSAYQGFLYNGSTFTSLTVPGAEDTYAYGISDNNIVGCYKNSKGVSYGFLATPVPAFSLTATTVEGQLELSVSGPSAPAIVQASTNMVNWVSVFTNTLPFTFTDSAVTTFPSRFYRARISQ